MEGRNVRHYRVDNKIGAGGMGVVYRAVDTKLKRTVALKFLPHGISTETTSRERFLREAMAAAAMDNPHICTIYEINETEDGQLFMAMAYYPGETLSHFIQTGGPLALDRALEMAIQLCHALDYAHARGVVHRDIKPANIMLHDSGLKVLDFGLAKLAGEAGITQAGTSMGTPRYMSPEQACGQEADHRTDIWSAGAVFYEMLTGEPPFYGSTRQAVLAGILSGIPPSALARIPTLPAEVDWIIAKSLAKTLTDRYSSAAAMLADLQSLRHNERPLHTGPRSIVQPQTSNAMAVLPFENISSDKENEYFSDGLTEDLIDALSRLPGLRVVSRTSVFQFKGKAQDVREIGQILKVESILEGSVRRSANRLRINVQLTDVSTGYQTWSQRYDREMDDIFAVQDEISSSVVTALKLSLTTRQAEAVKASPGNIEAYQLYLRGRFHWNKKSPDGMQQARVFFERALKEDPNYALAWAGMAQYYTISAVYWLAPAQDAWPLAKAAAIRAIELDPRLPDGHSLLGSFRGFYEHDWATAERELQTAIQLSPGFVEAHLYLCYVYLATARLDAALRSARKAVECDPLSLAANSAEALALLYSGRFDAAMQRFRNGLEIDPQFVEFHYGLGLANQCKGQHADAVEAFERGAQTSGRMPLLLGWLAAAYASHGRHDDAKVIVAELLEHAEKRYPVPLPLAVAYAGLGDHDQAFEWLNRAADACDSLLCYIQVMPTWDKMRDDPRYGLLLNRLGLADQLATALMTARTA